MNDLSGDLSEVPLWRLIVLLDDLERAKGAFSPDARRIAKTIVHRLGIVSEIGPAALEQAVADERERCEKVAESCCVSQSPLEIAEEIRKGQ